MSKLQVTAPDEATLDVAEAAFRGLQRGALTGDWDGFLDLLAEDVRIMIPVPAVIENPPEGVLVGRDIARQLFASHHEEQVDGVRLEAKRVSGNGSLVVLEVRVEGNLGGETAANFFVFAFEVADGMIASMYEYASWNAKHPSSKWTDVTFGREAFPETVIPLDPTLDSAEQEVRA